MIPHACHGGLQGLTGVGNVKEFCQQLCTDALIVAWFGASGEIAESAAGEYELLQALGKTIWRCALERQVHTPSDPAIPQLEVHPRRVLDGVLPEVCAPKLSNSVQENAKCPTHRKKRSDLWLLEAGGCGGEAIGGKWSKLPVIR